MTYKINFEATYGWKHYTENDITQHLKRLYNNREFILYGISIGLNQLKNIRHKFGLHIQAKIADIDHYLHRQYNELDMIDDEIIYFQYQQTYYDDIQFKKEDTYTYY